MDIKATKIELAKLILSLENPSLIQKIRDLLKSETENFADTLTEHEEQEIGLAIKLLDQGERTSYDDFLKSVS